MIKLRDYNWLAAVLVVLSMAGCRSTAMSQPTYAYETIKPGSTLVLHSSIQFPAFSAAVDIQYGNIRSGFGLDQYRPHCRLEMKSQSDQARLIRPGSFSIYKISNYIEYVMLQPIKVAGRGVNLTSSVTDEIYSTTLYLKSEQQPEIELLACQHWEDPSNFPAHLTLEQIQQTLDGLMTIETH